MFRMEVTREAVAAEVRAVMGRKNKSAKWLSEATGISKAALSRKLNGSVGFTLAEAMSIATALGVSLSDLVPTGDRTAA